MNLPIEFPALGLDDGAVTVRLIAQADLPEIVVACNDEAIARYTTVPSPYQPEHAQTWLARASVGISSGTDLAAVVVDSREGGLLGSVGLHGIDRISGRCTAGYWVAEQARGRGVASRALRLISAYAFDELGMRRIELTIEPANQDSRAVAERCGFVREGLLRSFMIIAGARRDMLIYALISEDRPRRYPEP